MTSHHRLLSNIATSRADSQKACAASAGVIGLKHMGVAHGETMPSILCAFSETRLQRHPSTFSRQVCYISAAVTARGLTSERSKMNEQKSNTAEVEHQQLMTGLFLKQAAAICDSNRGALVAIVKQESPAFADADEGAKAFVEVLVRVLNSVGLQLSPRSSSKLQASDAKLAPEEIQAMMERSGRAVRNAASICKANREMLLAFFTKETDQAGGFVELAVDVLNTYGRHLSYDDDIENFEIAGNPFRFR
jgi:hypothetical protein